MTRIMKLVIVESPTKARKLRSYLGSDFQVEASVGHVRDLPQKKLGVDIENNFEPTYEVAKDKQKVVNLLKKLAKDADTVYLAMDPDREGEAIAWHVQALLSEDKKAKKGAESFFRSTFHEITKSAVMAAIEKPTTLNLNLVDAQQARRVLDRLVGYKVSPVLWKKVRRGLSAGRVQSVALRLIVEREKEIEAFIAEEYWEVDVALNTDTTTKPKQFFTDGKAPEALSGTELVSRVIELDKGKYEPHAEADVADVVVGLKSATYTISSVEQKERKRWSLPPFTTSTLQQGAANRLGFTSKQTMTLAQQLYEEGLITYHRTDSVALSQGSMDMAREYISQAFGSQYLPAEPRFFSNKSKNAQEAHEAIRVTDAARDPETIIAESSRFTDRHVKLYDLIRRRFLASQMERAVYDQTSILIEAKPTQPAQFNTATLRTSGSVLRFDGWMRLFPSGDDTILPDVKEKQELAFMDLAANQKFTQPPPRYNDASLVKELEKRGIGRPSTYASIISVIEDRGYVSREDKKFLPTVIGVTVSDFLVQHFPNFMEYAFTAEMEEDLDRISRGEKEWRKVLAEFYGPLEKKIDETVEHADRAQIPVEKTGQACPKCGDTEHGEVVIRMGRFGKFLSCHRYPECDYTDKFLEKVDGVKCPLCQQGDVITKNTRWGKSFFGCERYPDCDWASWRQPKVGETITQAEWDEQKAAREARKSAKAAAMADKNGETPAKTTKKVPAKKKPATKKPAQKKA
jgi:DNA topoisomerase I